MSSRTAPSYGFVIDNRRCIGCHACTVACKTEHSDPVGVNKTWVQYLEKAFTRTQSEPSMYYGAITAQMPPASTCVPPRA